jgi:hypothetical protein
MVGGLEFAKIAPTQNEIEAVLLATRDSLRSTDSWFSCCFAAEMTSTRQKKVLLKVIILGDSG